jgi:hypothetical protein
MEAGQRGSIRPGCSPQPLDLFLKHFGKLGPLLGKGLKQGFHASISDTFSNNQKPGFPVFTNPNQAI